MSQRKRRYSTSRSASWCPHPTLICTWATTPWLLPSVVFCCCCCVLHCTHWLCRCAGSRPCCCGAVLCVLRGGERISMQKEKGKRKEGRSKMESNQKMSETLILLSLSLPPSFFRPLSLSPSFFRPLSLSLSLSLSCIVVGQRGEATIMNKQTNEQSSKQAF